MLQAVDPSQCAFGGCQHDLASPLKANKISKGCGGRAMSNASQAFLFTGEVFALSFAAIFVFWLADRLRSGFLAKR